MYHVAESRERGHDAAKQEGEGAEHSGSYAPVLANGIESKGNADRGYHTDAQQHQHQYQHQRQFEDGERPFKP